MRRRPPDGRRSQVQSPSLRDVCFFSRCTERELSAIARSGDVVKLPAGRTVQRRTDAAHWVYFVLDGSLAVQDGRRYEIHQQGSVVGLSEALDSSRVRSMVATVTTLTATILFVVERRRVEELLARNPRFALGLIRQLVSADSS